MEFQVKPLQEGLPAGGQASVLPAAPVFDASCIDPLDAVVIGVVVAGYFVLSLCAYLVFKIWTQRV